uniref:Putative disease resistance protein RPM1-like isoform X2 n=1 Tax=Davidia involucrata TaxID=16924 RepID=A0A5B6ZAS1_DAVIN
MAEIAVSLVVDKLVPLLEQKVNLLSGVRGEVESIITELQFIQPWLRDADERAEKGKVNDGVKVWVKKVRQVSHRMEDVIDEYILHLAQHPQQRRGFISFLQKVSCLIIKLKPRYKIANEIQDIRTSIRETKEIGDRYGFSSTLLEASSSSTGGNINRWDDPRVASLFIEEAEVVGIESPRDELISWLLEEASKRTVISVVGMGGLGKTTLAKKVFDNNIVTENFVSHAWISVSQSYTMKELLRTTIREFYEDGKQNAPGGIDDTTEMASLITKLREYLQDKRYVVIFDDVWDPKFWDTIKLALPDNNNGSRVIITTRNESKFDHVHKLQPLPLERALELFWKKAFQWDYGGHWPRTLDELSRGIVERCGGLPLAIVAIGGLLSTKDESQWKTFHNSLRSELESNPHLTDIKRILSLSYLDLPYFLKPCFLYFGIFPEDYSISCVRLVRLWIAEGFVKEKKGKTLEEVAEEYLTELIHRSLVQVSWVDFAGKARSCRVHDLLHEIILSKFEELGFCQLLAEEHSNFDEQTRRLSIHNREHINVLKNITESRIRSVFFFGVDKLPESFMGTLSTDFKLLKVLDFEDAPLDCVHEEVGNLFHLRYLSVRNTKVKTLPKSIGRLHNLLTLDLKMSLVSELPVEINKLHKLRHLLAYYEDDEIDYPLNPRQGMKIQEGFGCLEALQKLYFVEANDQGHKLMKELRELRQLRKLGIFKLRSEDGKALCNAIENMSYLECLEISSGNGDGILDLQNISSSLRSLQRLYLRGHLGKFPDWIPKLENLVRIGLFCSGLTEDPLKIIQGLPSLLEIRLYRVYDGEHLYFEEGGFQKLKVLELRYLNSLNSVIIKNGALPLLEKLSIGPSPQLKKVPSGIQHLRNLTIVRFYEMPDEFNDGMMPNEGEDYQVVEHVPTVLFRCKGEGGQYDWYTLR